MKWFAVVLSMFLAGHVPGQRPSTAQIRFLSDRTSSELPLRSSSNLVLVETTVNGSAPGWFILDTGAASTVIDTEFAKSLGLKQSGTTIGTGSAGSATAGIIREAKVQIGDLEASGLTIYSLPLSSFTPGLGLKASGIIGNDIISKVVMEIDYAAERVRLHSPATFAAPAVADVVPITMGGNLPFIHTRIVPTGRRPLEAKCELDTGSTGTVLFNSPYVIKNRLVSSLGRSMVAKSGGVGGSGLSKVGRIKSLELGKSVIRDPIAILFQGVRGENASRRYDCLLGGAIFRRFKIAFDMTGGRLFLEPTSTLNDPFETDMSGLELLGDGNDLKTILVDDVHLGSAGARAGVKGGDVLIAIDGRPAAELGLQEVRRLLRQNGAEYELTLRRGKSEVKVRIALKRVI